ncbi:glutathione S-transferase family protein [Ovoidimarina sediminis]|uniref:glutathione S-transferase family protein n=1 Tax=Ovoidimarina sediminis TaxID=3079856 RepID=UPI002906408C|nr:glutathione S-transferase family protein [Rhodophyticola sp. MJ-SS7]MDU8943780.1 glutathione S-transferase family protein [Rhodophyticola sp. MJ-SS7]
MLKLVGYIRSRAFRVLWALEEMGLDYEHDPAAPRSEEVRALNPSGKIPILIDGDAVLTESTAILTYLSDRYGGLAFPSGSVERARQDAATFTLLDELDAPLWALFKHRFLLPEELRTDAIKPAALWEIQRAETHFARRVGAGPFVMGDTFTIPDILAGHLGDWADRAGFGSDDPDWLAYLDRLRARPAFQKVNATAG